MALTREQSSLQLVNTVLAESVYRSGDIANVIEQAQAPFTLLVKPHCGRSEDVVRRLSRLADIIHQCMALGASVRQVIAESDSPRIVIHTFHARYAEWEATRKAAMESDCRQEIIRSQDDSSVLMQNTLSTRFEL